MSTIPSNPKALAQFIDHTLLRPDATEAEILKLCDEAKEFAFKSVCIEMRWLPVAAQRLKGSAVLPITVISFPHGNDPTDQKKEQTKRAVALGAREIDMVLNRELLKARAYQEVMEDVRAVVEAAEGRLVKVILETSELTDMEKRIACVLVQAGGAGFVKTSTGFSKAGATVNDVALMRETVAPNVGVKASGGVRTFEDAKKMIAAGATRLGTSAGVSIIQGALPQAGAY